MSVDVVTFGCRLNIAESEVIRRAASRLDDTVVVNTCAVTAEAVRQARQTIRRIKRERPERASSSPAARRRPSRALSPRCPRSTASSAMRRSSTREPGRRSARCRRRHHGGDAARGAPSIISTATRAPSCRCRTAATTAAPSASSRSAAAIRARCRWARWWRRRAAYRARLSRGGAHRRRYHELRPGLPGVPARRAGETHSQACPRAGAPAAVVDRLGRGRRRSSRRVRQRAAPDAASASVAAVRRRPHPQAHEAPAHARRRHRVLRSGAPAAPGRRLRRRYHRRLPDRDRGHVRALARSGRGMRAHASACVSVLAASRHAGRAHAAGRARHRQGARPRLARQGRGGAGAHLDAQVGARRGAHRTRRHRAHRAVHPGAACGAGRAGRFRSHDRRP